MADRISALAGHAERRRYGTESAMGVTLVEVPDLVLSQAAAWPDTLVAVGAKAAAAAGAEAAPGPGRAAVGTAGTLLRVEPLKWWLLGTDAPELAPETGTTLDLSHARSHIRLSGPEATTLLNRHLPLDLRPAAFPVGAVASTAFHHAGVTLWRSETAYEFFPPRGFALSLWEMLLESAAQFGTVAT